MPWRLTLHRNIHAACVPVLNRISTVVAAAHLVNDVSLLVFNQGEESFLVFSPVWIPRRDLHCIPPQHGTPPSSTQRRRRKRGAESKEASNGRKQSGPAAGRTRPQSVHAARSANSCFCRNTQSHTCQNCPASPWTSWHPPRMPPGIQASVGGPVGALPTCESFSTWALSET